MARQPVAFLSYVHSDDAHDGEKITKFRKRLEGELKMQLGKPLPIFQDRNDIAWGQHWESRIDRSILEVTFLIPMLTPSFFQSPTCRKEFETFSLKERQLGLQRLILPVVYVTCDELGPDFPQGADPIAEVVKSRQWTDWRPFRFKELSDPEVSSAIADLAIQIKEGIRELERELLAEAESRGAKQDVSSTKPKKAIAKKKKPKDPPIELVPPSEDYTLEILEARPAKAPPRALSELQRWPYYVFTRQHDEVVRALDLSTPEELARLRTDVAERAEFVRSNLDIIRDGDILRFAKSASISLLVDNSGSLRGKPIQSVAAACLVLVEYLELAGAEVEVLGYTTRAWKGGQSREDWLAAGKPNQPGRLNDIRHIIYKGFDESGVSAVASLPLMLREGILKENIDGEALLWASERLISRQRPSKLLAVISDGAPVDDSTLSVNRASFLDGHLRFVIGQLTARRDLALIGIGVGHDTSRYYPTAFQEEPANIGAPVIEWLKSPTARRKVSR